MDTMNKLNGVQILIILMILIILVVGLGGCSAFTERTDDQRVLLVTSKDCATLDVELSVDQTQHATGEAKGTLKQTTIVGE